jgi:hypothetical protein
MKMSKKRTRKINQKHSADNHQNSMEQHKKGAVLFENLVIKKNDYYDQLTTEDAVLLALEKFDLPDSK